jgi:hypothetical protein
MSNRFWIKVGDDPYRFEYGHRNDSPRGARVEDALAYVEEERSGYFRWEAYTDPHEKGAKPDRMQAQEKALEVLREKGQIP